MGTLAIMVFPVPGGPYISTPLGGSIPVVVVEIFYPTVFDGDQYELFGEISDIRFTQSCACLQTLYSSTTYPRTNLFIEVKVCKRQLHSLFQLLLLYV